MSGNPMDQGYVLVAERLAAFVKDHPNGRIETRLVASHFDPAVLVEQEVTQRGEKILLKFKGAGLVVVEAKVFKTAGSTEPDGTGLASMTIPGQTNYTRFSETENAETSAVGRALAMIGYLAKNPDGSARFASDDEIRMKKEDTDERPQPADPKAKASRPQINRMFALAKEAGIDTKTPDGKKLLQDIVLAATGKHSSTQLTMGDMDKVFTMLEKGKDDAQLESDRLAAIVEASGGEVVA